MTVKIVAVSLAALAASIAVRAAAPAPGQELRVDITAPVAGTRLQWQSQAPYAVTVSYDGKSTRFGEVPSNAVVLRAAYVANADAPPRARGIAGRNCRDQPVELQRLPRFRCQLRRPFLRRHLNALCRQAGRGSEPLRSHPERLAWKLGRRQHAAPSRSQPG